MTQTCLLADTGTNKYLLYSFIAVLFGVGALSFFLSHKRGKGFKNVPRLFSALLLVGALFFIGTAPIYAGQASDTCIETGANRVWTPSGRFTSSVFTANQILTQTNVNFGSLTNIDGETETLRMTIYQPVQTVDSETFRPLIFAFPGGETAGLCDETFATEEAAMFEMAKYGYVTVAVHNMLDDRFCSGGGATATDYTNNMLLNLSAINKAIQYMYDNYNTFKIDPNNTALYGYSIGGQVSLLKLREDHTGAPKVKVLAGFAAIASKETTYVSSFSALAPATSSSPSVLMVSYLDDEGYPGLTFTPDAKGDCEYLADTLGHNCTFEGVPGTGHPVHANSSGLTLTPSGVSASNYFKDYMYKNMILK